MSASEFTVFVYRLHDSLNVLETFWLPNQTSLAANLKDGVSVLRIWELGVFLGGEIKNENCSTYTEMRISNSVRFETSRYFALPSSLSLFSSISSRSKLAMGSVETVMWEIKSTWTLPYRSASFPKFYYSFPDPWNRLLATLTLPLNVWP